MSYTPPAGNAVIFSWQGKAAYTPPAGDAIELSFAANIGAASIAISASGSGTHSVAGAASSSIPVTSTGTTAHGVTASGAASIPVTASAQAAVAVFGDGSAQVAITAGGAGSFGSTAGSGSGAIAIAATGSGAHGVSVGAGAVIAVVASGTGATINGLSASHAASWGDALHAVHSTGYGDMQPLVQSHLAAWAMLTTAAKSHQSDWSITTTNPRTASHQAAWSMPIDAHLRAVENTPTLTHAGRPIGMLGASLSCDEGSAVWLARLALKSISDYAAINVGDALTLTLGDEVFAFVADGKALSRNAPDDVGMEITAMSPACLYDAPFAGTTAVTWHGTARDLVESLIGPVDWRLPDWTIPTGQAAFADATPLQIARRVAEAVGGLVESNPDGSIVCRRRHPVSIPAYAQSTPDHILTDGDMIGMSATIAPVRGMDRVTISNDTSSASASSRIEYLPDADSQSSGTLRVWPAAGKSVDVVHTGNASTVLVPTGQAVRTHSEVVEFIDGLASVQYPITAVTSSTWQRANLGSVTASGTTLSASVPGYSLLAITYTTTAQTWRVSLNADEAVQFILMET